MPADARLIANTAQFTHHSWPADCTVQGGDRGVVFSRNNSHEPYRTAFVEALVAGTFLRGEGATIADAEDSCWAQYQTLINCKDHGPYERRHYRNGSGFCTKCGTWFPDVLPELPEDPSHESGLFERIFGGRDVAAAIEALNTYSRVKSEGPDGPPENGPARSTHDG